MQCPYFEDDGVSGDRTIHVFTHFIRRKEVAIRDYLRKNLMSRLDFFTQVSTQYLTQAETSAEDYIDKISTEGIPLDLLGIFLIARLYQFHIAVVFHKGVWMTNKDNDWTKTMFTLVFQGVQNYSETCKEGQSGLYLQSLVNKTNSALMPPHCADLKVSISSDDETEQKTDIKKIKVEFKKEVSEEKTRYWSSKFSVAAKLLAKAKKEKYRSEIKKEKQAQIHTLIYSGTLRPVEIAHEARQGHKMIHVLCDICNITCRSQRNYIVHMKEHHPQVTFPCSICGKQYRTWSGRFKHEKTHSGQHYVCMICGRAFKTLDALNHHTPVHNPESKRYCETCGKGFATKSSLKCHEKIHLNLCIPCPNCDKTFNTEEKVQQHR